MSEKRTDPDDGREYTFSELCEKYAGEFTHAEIQEYWSEDMASDRVAEGEPRESEALQSYLTPDASEFRIDPENNHSYSYQSFKNEKMGDFTEEEIIAYWFEEMLLDLPEGTKVFVGNLGRHVSEKELLIKCREVGEVVRCHLMTHPESKESMGYATVQYRTPGAAEEAVNTLKGKDFAGQNLEMKRLFDKGKNKSLFVACFGRDTTLSRLIQTFLVCGEIGSVEIIVDENSGEPKGQAKLDFVFPESVLKAISMFDMQELDGRRIHVSEWILDERGRRRQGPSCFVQKLNHQTTAAGLRACFESTGAMIVDVMIMLDRETGESRGIGKVEFTSKACAKKAVEMLNDTELDGNRILVRGLMPSAAEKKLSTNDLAAFVGGLPSDCTVDQLQELFRSAGPVVNAFITKDRTTGKSRGFAKVLFQDEEGRKRALEKFDGFVLNGRTISVRPFQAEGSVTVSSTTTMSAGSRADENAIFIGGLAYEVTVADLKAYFESCGAVAYAKILTDKETGKQRGVGKVIFSNKRSKEAAISDLDGKEFMGKTLIVRDFASGKFFSDTLYSVHVSGMPLDADREALKAHFQCCGQIMVANLLTEKGTGKVTGVGKVVFTTEEARAKAVKELDGSEMHGHVIKVRTFTSSRPLAGIASSGTSSEGVIFVGGLGTEVTATDLKAHFEECGEILMSHIMLDKTTGNSRGAGKVVFSSQEAKDKAIRDFHLSDWDGRKIGVREFGEKRPSSSAGTATTSVFVARMSSGTTASMLREHFAGCGRITEVFIFLDKDGNRRGAGRVEFATEAEKDRAIKERDGSKLDNEIILVREYTSEKLAARTGSATSSPSKAMCAVFIARLSSGTTAAMLREHFAECGEIIEARVFADKDGNSRGVGKVEFATEAEKDRALLEWDGSELDGQIIVVREYMPGRLGEGQSHKSQSYGEHKVFVVGLNSETTSEALQAYFEVCGRVVSAYVSIDKETGKSKGSAKVSFFDAEAKAKAFSEMNGSTLHGCTITILDWVPRGASSNSGASTSTHDKSVFVRGLNLATRSDALKAHFEGCGKVVSANIMLEKETGKSKGAARVTFATADAFSKAVSQWDRSNLDGRMISVQPFISGQMGTTGNTAKAVHAVFVAGLSPGTGSEALRAHFADCGDLLDCQVFMDRDTGNSKCAGKVSFSSEEAWKLALSEWNESELDDRIISVREFTTSPPKRAYAESVHSIAAGRNRCHDENCIFIKGLHRDTDTEALRVHFEACGEIVSCEIFFDKDTLVSKGMAKITFADLSAKVLALQEWDGSELDCRTIRVLDDMSKSSSRAQASDAGKTVGGSWKDGSGSWNGSADGSHDFWEVESGVSSTPTRPTPSMVASAVSPTAGSLVASLAKDGVNEMDKSVGSLACSMTINDWLQAVDEQWLRHLSQTPRRNFPNRGVREFHQVIEEEFDSVDQIVKIYGVTSREGLKVLKDDFFIDCGITKIGHKRMFNKWVSENL